MNDNELKTEAKLAQALVNLLGDRGLFTPEFLAKMFCNMFAEEQAAFFSWVGAHSSKWDKHRGTQWCSMQEHMTADGLKLLREMLEHIEAMETA